MHGESNSNGKQRQAFYARAPERALGLLQPSLRIASLLCCCRTAFSVILFGCSCTMSVSVFCILGGIYNSFRHVLFRANARHCYSWYKGLPWRGVPFPYQNSMFWIASETFGWWIDPRFSAGILKIEAWECRAQHASGSDTAVCGMKVCPPGLGD